MQISITLGTPFNEATAASTLDLRKLTTQLKKQSSVDAVSTLADITKMKPAARTSIIVGKLKGLDKTDVIILKTLGTHLAVVSSDLHPKAFALLPTKSEFCLVSVAPAAGEFKMFQQIVAKSSSAKNILKSLLRQGGSATGMGEIKQVKRAAKTSSKGLALSSYDALKRQALKELTTPASIAEALTASGYAAKRGLSVRYAQLYPNRESAVIFTCNGKSIAILNREDHGVFMSGVDAKFGAQSVVEGPGIKISLRKVSQPYATSNTLKKTVELVFDIFKIVKS